MKRITSMMSMVLLGALSMTGCAGQVIVRQPVVAPPQYVQPEYGPAVDMFYDDLSPYGTWVMVDGPGWVWRPDGVAADWRPYVLGRWVYTDYGWTWASEEEWGWAAYHYGRWHHAPGYGWVWVPGTDWGPAWVTWHSGSGWIGWAPLPWQVEWRAGSGLHWGHVDVRVAIQPAWWCFVDMRHLSDPRPARYIVPPTRNVKLINITKNITNYTYVDNRVFNGGVHVNVVSKAAGRPVPRARVRHADFDREPGGGDLHGDEIVAFKPGLRRGQQAGGPPGHSRRGYPEDRATTASDEPDDVDRPVTHAREETTRKDRPTHTRPDDRPWRSRPSEQGPPPQRGQSSGKDERQDERESEEQAPPRDRGRSPEQDHTPGRVERPGQGPSRGQDDAREPQRTPQHGGPQRTAPQDDAGRGSGAEQRAEDPGPKTHHQPAVDQGPKQGPNAPSQPSGQQTSGSSTGKPKGKNAKPGGKPAGKPAAPESDDKGADQKPEPSKSDDSGKNEE